MRRERGLTLLEMLLVVFILSAVSLGAVALVDRQEDSLRLDETRTKLRQIRAAILGRSPSAEGGEALGGYVVDTGTLPGTVEDLVRPPLDPDAAHGLKAPAFDASTTLDAALHGVPKGWRGPYLTLPPSRDPVAALFRDGWENGTRDDVDHGWVLSRSGANLAVASRGPDGSLGAGGGGTGDEVAVAIGGHDWLVDVEGWQVTAAGLPAGGSGYFARLLVASWDAATGAWAWTAFDSAEETADADGRATLRFAFDAAEDHLVPVGRHVLVLGRDGAPFDAGQPGSPVHVSAQLRFHAREDLPAATLVVKGGN